MTAHRPQHARRTPIPFVAVALPAVGLVALFLTWQVHRRAGDESFICDTGAVCALGSGGSWLLTGVTLTGPFVALLGFAWSRWLHRRDKLGPFSPRAIPDSEQMVEVFAVLGAGLATYWLLGNGASIEAADLDQLGRPNSWLIDGRDIASDEPVDAFVPTRFTWFQIGTILSAPFAFSLGSMLGREWYGRQRRANQDAESDEEVIDLTTIDLTNVESEHIDEN